MSRVTAVILNWRDPSSTIACLGSLTDLKNDINIVVVDNDSKDGSFEQISHYIESSVTSNGYSYLRDKNTVTANPLRSKWISLVSSGRNGGYAYGNNFGIKIALAEPDCEYIWILNADVIVPNKSALTELTAYMDKHVNIGICGATVCYMDRPGVVQTLGGGTIDKIGKINQLGQGLPIPDKCDTQSIEGQLNYVNGACSFVRRRFIEEIGLMTEDYFLYFEELDWIARGKHIFRLGYCYDSVVLHHVGKSIGTKDHGGRSTLSVYYMNASLIKYCRRHQRGLLPFVLSRVAAEFARYFRRGEWRISTVILCALFQTGAKLPKKLRLI